MKKIKQYWDIYYPIILAFVTFLYSISLWFSGQKLEGIFVGIWVPSILAFAIAIRQRRNDFFRQQAVARRGKQIFARTTLKGIKGAGEGFEFLGKGGLQNFFKGAFGKDLKETRGLLRQFNLESSSVRPTGQLAGMKFGNKIDDIFKSFKDLRKVPNSTWKGINDTFKAQKDLALNIRKVGVDKVKAFFNAPMQGLGKGLTATGTGLKNLPGQTWNAWAGATKNISKLKQSPQMARGV